MKAILYLLDASNLSPERLSLLSLNNQERYQRFLKEEDKKLFLGSRLLMKEVLGTDEVKTKDNGKPYLDDGARFSLSHAYPYVGLLVSQVEVGLDIESKSRDNLKAVREYLHLSEDEDASFIWSLKEALYKCDGEGSFNPKEEVKTLGTCIYQYRDKRYYGYQLEHPSHMIVCVSSEPLEIEMKEDALKFAP